MPHITVKFGPNGHVAPRLFNINCGSSSLLAAVQRLASADVVAFARTKEAAFRKAATEAAEQLVACEQRLEKLGDEATDEQKAELETRTQARDAHAARQTALAEGLNMFRALALGPNDAAVQAKAAAAAKKAAAEAAAAGGGEGGEEAAAAAGAPAAPVQIDLAPEAGGDVINLRKQPPLKPAGEVLEAKATYVLHCFVLGEDGTTIEAKPMTFDIPALPGEGEAA